MIGDCIDSIKSMDDGIIQTCITSPPYFGLRDYQTGTWVGGDENCQHKIGEIRTGQGMAYLGEKFRGGGHKAAEEKPIFAMGQCPHCGAVRVDKQIGIEKTPFEYVNKLVEVFREVRRVLRDDGTLWLNLGDSYSAVRGGGHGYKDGRKNRSERKSAGLVGRPKNLLGIPWKVAFALQDDGWYLRQDIIWHKTNPMPESVKDRCTKAHEYIFLFSKSPRYYFDSDAIKEKAAQNRWGGNKPMNVLNSKDIDGVFSGLTRSREMMPEKRNKRSVWTVSTKPYKGAHFATFPIDLIEPCILAGSKPGDLILDPFAGSGTVGQAALKHSRRSILCELNPEYEKLIIERIGKAA